MQIKKIHIRVQKLCVTLCYTVVSISCTQAEMMYRQVVTIEELVRIYPDNSTHILPAQKYYFYNQDGVTPCRVLTCDGYGNFTGTLPDGTYHIIASNANVTNAVYSGMGNHETAMVSAKSIYTRNKIEPTRTDILVSVDNIYSVVVKQVTVSSGDTLHLTPTPSLLTRTVTLNFSVDEELQDQVIGLTGTLRGVYPSVQLFTGETKREEMEQAPEIQIGYIASQDNEKKEYWTAILHVFGLHDPKYGENYQNMGEIILETVDNQHRVEVDLTDALSNILEEYEGEIPVSIPIEVNVEVKLVEIGIAATVESWKYINENGTEVIVPISIE